MLISKALVAGSMFFAFFSILAMFWSLFLTQLKFEDVSEYNFLSQDNSVWFKPKVKVVMFIVDALRFDYLLNYKNIDHDPKLQVNKLNKFNKAYFDHPERFQIIRALSDTPTATVMRVPSLMTGNVPRKGSVLTAFGALPSIEDSIPRQLFNHGKKTFFSGDPILAQYFPKYLVANTEVEGFNIRDDQVDEPSRRFIEKHIQDDDYDLLISHLLGIDHMGHQYDLYNKHFLQSMKELDDFLMKIMNMIDDNTMLIFAGDHGMAKEGAHGDGSLQEVNTAIVAYHKKGINKVMKSINETKLQNHQADIVPTLSMLMGVPVPFSSMGKILNDLYPAGDYMTKENCTDSAFEMQMLHDNHLNTRQVWNYFKKYHDGQTLFSEKEYSNITSLLAEVEDAYKAAQKMVKENRQCEDSFHEIAIKAIEKSQLFSNTVYGLVSETPPYDYIVFWQGFFMLALVCVSYFLIVHYLYKTKDYEHIAWKKPAKGWKAFIPIGVILSLIWIVAQISGSVIMRPITSSVLAFAVWISGSAIIYFLPKRTGYSESIPSTPGVIDESRETIQIISLKSLLKVQDPKIMLAGVGIVIYLFYLTHFYVIDSFKMANIAGFNQFMVAMLIAARLCGKFPKFTKEITIAALMVFPILYMVDTPNLWIKYGRIKIGLLLIADWLWGEIQFSHYKLQRNMLWSFHYVIHFVVLIAFHLIMGPSDDFNQIFLPRVVWGIIIASIMAGFALRLPRQAIKRHIQINFVLYLVLMARPGRFLNFAIVLSIMRVIKYIFKKTSLKNPLYSMLLGFVGYVGMFASGYMDGRLPRAFGPAFVGLREFHLYFGITAFSIAMTSTIILGMLFISFFDQEMAADQQIKLGVPSEDDSNNNKVMVAQEGFLRVVKKRNALYYCFFYSLVMIGAAFNTQAFKGAGRFALDKFLVDASLYFIVINTLYFML